MERRTYPRYRPKTDVLAALLFPTREDTLSVIGRLIDISPSGLALVHSPLHGSTVHLNTPPCEVMLKYSECSFSKPLMGEIVYDLPLGFGASSSVFFCPEKRYGIRLISTLPHSDIQNIIDVRSSNAGVDKVEAIEA